MVGTCNSKIASSRMRSSCGVGLPSLSIAHDGTAYPCASINDARYALGNVKSTSPVEICRVARELSGSWSVDHLPSCRNCDVRYVCGGGCRAVSLALRGDPLAHDPLWKEPGSDDCTQRSSILETMWAFPDYQILKQLLRT